jgi:Na+/H+-dicarboxylate symporter
MAAPAPPGSFGKSLTAWSLAALAAGVALGVLGHASGDPRFGAFADAIAPIGELWLSALRMTVLPLVIVYTLAAIAGARQDGVVGALAGRSFLLFFLLLAGAGLLTAGVAPIFLRLVGVDPSAAEAIRAHAAVPDEAIGATGAGYGSLRDWIGGLLPENAVAAAVRGDIFPFLLFSVLFGAAVTRLPDDQRELLTRVFRALSGALLVCVRWVLVPMPVGVFAFTFRFALASGDDAVRFLGVYIAAVCALMLLCTALLYPLTALLGRRSAADFARAVAPAQLIAVTTRSSIASLPALIQGARDPLRLPDAASGLVLPLAVSVFKLDLTVSNTVKLLFLAHVYRVSIGPGTLATFLLFIIVLSFSSPGIPSVGTFRTLPAYLAAGVPIEGVVMVQAVETIPDIFMTLLNVTADMSAATVLSRSSRESGRAARPDAAASPASGAA